jgi:hypothetical protein
MSDPKNPADAIKAAFAAGESLNIVRTSGMFSVEANGKEPKDWNVVHFADIGTDEEFVHFFSGELLRLADGSMIFDQREQLKQAIAATLIEGLMPAFERLKNVRASVGQRLTELVRRQYYEDFAHRLWHAYKDLMLRATLCTDTNIGFIFQNSKTFESELKAFEKRHPEILPLFGEKMREHRDVWQNELGSFRNYYLEHKQHEISKYRKFYTPEHAEFLFDTVWKLIAEILVTLIAARYPPAFSLEAIPEAERDPKARLRFRYVQKGCMTETSRQRSTDKDPNSSE